MERNLVIDMSQAHLIPERIREYAMRVFDCSVKNPPPDHDAEIFLNLVSLIENRLAKEPLDSPLFAQTNAIPNGKLALKALREGYDKWLGIRYPNPYMTGPLEPIPLGCTWFPYFFTYIYDNNLEQRDAVSSLLEYFQISIPKTVSIPNTVSIPEKRINQTQECMNYSMLPLAGNRYIEDSNISNGGKYILFNTHLLEAESENKRRPVFMIDSYTAAHQLENEVWFNHIKTSIYRIADDLRVEIPEVYTLSVDTTSVKDNLTVIDHLKNLLRTLPQFSYKLDYPLGDVIWVSPVGGYAIPWWNDFQALVGRDIYIFKMNFVNQQCVLPELLDIYSYLPPHEDNKVRFVLFSHKVSPFASQNDIKILKIGEIFDLCDIEGIEIPEKLRAEYDQHLRDTNKKRSTSNFIVEPFLRKNSWALLTGEEGVGKSYFSMALGTAIAAKGTLFRNWKVCHHGNKVLYITDDEMSNDILAERLRVLHRMYRKSENFITEQVHGLNLLNGGKEEIERLIANAAMKGEPSKAVNVLILDHLLKLSNAEGDQRDSWSSIRDWIETLTHRGISVLLLHHEYGGRKTMGTRLIANDVPAWIHLERQDDPAPTHLTVGVSIHKNRGGKDQRIPVPITLVIDKRKSYWICEGNAEITWKSLSQEEKTKKIQTERDAGKTVFEIAKICNVSKSTIEKWITKYMKQLSKM